MKGHLAAFSDLKRRFICVRIKLNKKEISTCVELLDLQGNSKQQIS